MYSNSVKFALVCVVVVLILTACGIFIPEKDDVEPCPWNPERVGHHVVLPLKVIPNKPLYKVGDTVRFAFHESINVYDSNMDRRFDLSSFPFRPAQLMWRFDLIDSNIYAPMQNFNTVIEERFRPEAIGDSRGRGYRMWATIENDSFLAYTDVVLTAPGKYISTWYDVYSVTLESSGGDRSYAEPIEFEGKCQNHSLSIINDLVGDDYLFDYLPELTRIDSLFANQLYLVGAERGTRLDQGSRIQARQRGFFGFEVIE